MPRLARRAARPPSVALARTSKRAFALTCALTGVIVGASAGEARAEETTTSLDVIAAGGVDTAWTRDPRTPALGEDVARARLVTTLGAKGSWDDGVAFALEGRLWLETRAKRAASGWPLERTTYLYEATPTAAYVDVPLGAHARLRAGEQVVAWGKLDLLSAADVLGRRDLRTPPTVDPSLSQLPSPIVLVDADLGEHLEATIAWSVVSQPDRFDLFGTSWALVGPGVLGLAGPSAETLDRIARATDAATFLRVQEALAQSSTTSPAFFAGAPGDLAARVAAHVGGVDLALTYGWVRSKLPMLDVDPALRAVATRGDLASALDLVSALDQGRPLFTARYPRYQQLALDFEAPAGPVTIAWELGVSPSRPLVTLDDAAYPVEADRGLVQAGVRAQWVESEDLTLAGEVVAVEAVGHDDASLAEATHPLVVLGRRRALLGALATLHAEPLRHHALDVGVVATTSGPSLAIAPRYTWEASDAWSFGATGAFFPDVRGARGPYEVRLADTLVGRDFVEVFARYRR